MFCLRNAITLKFIYVYELDAAERAAALGAIERALAAGKLITNIGKTFPLADIVAAHEAVEAGNVLGNVVVQIAIVPEASKPQLTSGRVVGCFEYSACFKRRQ